MTASPFLLRSLLRNSPTALVMVSMVVMIAGGRQESVWGLVGAVGCLIGVMWNWVRDTDSLPVQ